MRRHLLHQSVITVASFLLLSGFLVGCTSDSPVSSSEALLVDSNDSPEFVSLLPTSSGDLLKPITSGPVSKQISASDGGSIGNGYVNLQFPPGALRADTDISITMLSPSKMVFELEPHGIQFEEPVLLSFDNVELSGETFNVYWYSEQLGQWVTINSGSNSAQLATELQHFSEYGISE